MTDHMADRPQVLIVDDRPDNLLALEAVLDPVDVDVVRANSGAEALRELLTREFAVILLDVQMPGLDGFETARHIKARDKTRQIPIIFLTAIDRGVDQQLRGYDVGAVDYQAKPFEPEMLRSKVSVFVELHRQAKLIAKQNRMLEERLQERDRAQAALSKQATELQRSNAELERFAFAASHDLREPLQVVAGLVELLGERYGPTLDDVGRRILDRARAGTTQMATLIDELLVYARVSTSALELRPLALEDVLAGAIEELAPAIAAAEATITNDPLPEVLGDEWQLRHLFVQLLDNAVKFRRGSPEIHAGVARQQGDWVMSVSDNGIGIDEADLPRVFGLFGRLHPTEDYDGQGVGLAICRRIVERHGGSIWAQSVPGRGTSVMFSLPGDDPTTQKDSGQP